MTTQNLLALLARHPVIASLPEARVGSLLRAAAVVTYRRGDSVWHLGHPADDFAFVLEGAVGRFLSGLSPRPLFASIDGAGAFSDLNASVRQARRTQSAVAFAARTTVAKIPQRPFREARGASPDSMLALLELVAEEGDAALRRLALSASLAPTRLAHLLLAISPPDAAGRRAVSLRITREHMAQFIGSTPETVTRTLTAWSAEGIVEKRARTLVLRDIARMEAIAQPSFGEDRREA